MKRTILVVDDHPIIYQGLLQMISDNDMFQVIGNAKTYEEAISIISSMLPDLVIVDIGLKTEKNGLDLIRECSAHYPMVKTMVLSMHDEEIFSRRAAEAGARGYVNKSEFTEKIIDAMSVVLSGELFFGNDSGDEGHKPTERLKMLINKLSDREFEVFRLLGKGYDNEKIAKKLSLKEKTIQSHKLRIRNKLNLESSADLIRTAVKWVSENSY
ncbi:MAG: response regulator transcription factor [Spirochaetota bacterium]